MESFVIDDARLRTPINPTSTHGAGFFGSQSHPLTSTEIGRKAHTHARRLLRDADMPCSDAERRTIEFGANPVSGARGGQESSSAGRYPAGRRDTERLHGGNTVERRTA